MDEYTVRTTYIFEYTLLEPVNVLITEKFAGKHIIKIGCIPTQYLRQTKDYVTLEVEKKFDKADKQHTEFREELRKEIELRKPIIAENLRRVHEIMERTKDVIL